ncbi:hypothetical protein [Stieleria sp.]|uniref:hypothetical protein n=1 Tax=Stieleria sp. TaxID=2795976 RepID=UPI003566C88A
MNIPWDLIFELLFKMLEDCDDDTEGRVSKIGQPMRLRVAVTRAVRQAGYRGREAIEVRREVLAEIADAPAEDVAAFAQSGPDGLSKLDTEA